jgi:hypothetical protein
MPGRTEHLHHDDGPHDHVHPHEHPGAEVLPEPSAPGSVLVDIGGDVGAAVVATPEHLDGEEIEIRPEPGEWTGRHVAVRPRIMPDRTVHAAVFGSLLAGSYVVRVRFGPPGARQVRFEVTGARVTQVVWPED